MPEEQHQEHHHHQERVEVEVLTTKRLKPINDAHRFALYSIGCFATLVTSFGYAFNLISHDMQKLLNLSMTDLADINTVGTTLQYGTFFYSIIFDYLGPILPVCMGIVLFIAGAITLALSFRRTIRPTLVRLCVFNGILNLSLISFELTANVAVTAHFPTARGLIIPLLKSYVGLGPAIVGTIQLAFFTNPEYFFYFLTALAVVVGIVMIIFMRLPRYHMTEYQLKHLSEEEKTERAASKAQYLRQKPATWRFVYNFVAVGILIVFLPIQSALLNYLHLGRNYKIGFAIATIIVTLLLAIVSIPVPSDRKVIEEMEKEHFEERNSEREANLSDVVETIADVDDKSCNEEIGGHQPKDTIVDYIAPQYQNSFLRSLLTLRYWALFWSIFCFSGAEFSIINYSSYVYASIDGKPVDQDLRTLLSVLNGVGSAAGRLLIALFEHLTQSRPPEKRIPITWAPMIPSTLITIGLILFLTLPPGPLPFAFIIMAIANGSQAAMTSVLPRTMYAKDVAKHYQFLFFAFVTATIIIVRFVFAEWYARQAKRNHNTDGYCFGKRCTLMPFCVMLGLVCTTYASNLYVCWRYWQYCNRALAERARLREEEMTQANEGADVDMIEELVQGTTKGTDNVIEGEAEDGQRARN